MRLPTFRAPRSSSGQAVCSESPESFGKGQGCPHPGNEGSWPRKKPSRCLISWPLPRKPCFSDQKPTLGPDLALGSHSHRADSWVPSPAVLREARMVPTLSPKAQALRAGVGEGCGFKVRHVPADEKGPSKEVVVLPPAHTSTFLASDPQENGTVKKAIAQMTQSLLLSLAARSQLQELREKLRSPAMDKGSILKAKPPAAQKDILGVCADPLVLAQQLTHMELVSLQGPPAARLGSGEACLPVPTTALAGVST